MPPKNKLINSGLPKSAFSPGEIAFMSSFLRWSCEWCEFLWWPGIMQISPRASLGGEGLWPGPWASCADSYRHRRRPESGTCAGTLPADVAFPDYPDHLREASDHLGPPSPSPPSPPHHPQPLPWALFVVKSLVLVNRAIVFREKTCVLFYKTATFCEMYGFCVVKPMVWDIHYLPLDPVSSTAGQVIRQKIRNGDTKRKIASGRQFPNQASKNDRCQIEYLSANTPKIYAPTSTAAWVIYKMALAILNRKIPNTVDLTKDAGPTSSNKWSRIHNQRSFPGGVWCRGGNRYVEGWWGFPRRKMQTTQTEDANHSNGRCKPPKAEDANHPSGRWKPPKIPRFQGSKKKIEKKAHISSFLKMGFTINY